MMKVPLIAATAVAVLGFSAPAFACEMAHPQALGASSAVVAQASDTSGQPAAPKIDEGNQQQNDDDDD
jgi:hypothetical protein